MDPSNSRRAHSPHRRNLHFIFKRLLSLAPFSRTRDEPAINLSSLLSLLGHGWGHRAARGRGSDQGREGSQGHGRRATAHSDVPPSFSPEEIAAGYRDKRQRPDPTPTGTDLPKGNLTTRGPTASIPIWAPQLYQGNHPVNVRDSADAEEPAKSASYSATLFDALKPS